MQANIIENNFRKVLVASQRARQLEKGARPMVATTATKITSVALQEVEQGLIGFEFVLSPEELAARRV